MELALQEALDANKIKIPVLVVDFSEHDPTGDVNADQKAGRLIDAVGRPDQRKLRVAFPCPEPGTR